jgi:hypothetical protein
MCHLQETVLKMLALLEPAVAEDLAPLRAGRQNRGRRTGAHQGAAGAGSASKAQR